MKKIFSLILYFMLCEITLYSQKLVSPNVNTEFCPLVNQSFSVTIPLIKSGSTVTLVAIGTPIIISGVSGLSSNGVNTTFTYVARFSDDNNTQSFRADYTKNDYTPDNFLMDYKKIKSLKFFSIPSTINTNIATINSPICQITTHNISFSNILFGNGFDGFVPGYGTAVTDYEYLLPINWKLYNTTSTVAWITANNNVTITTDLTSGSNTNIQIRALNTNCGITLAKSSIKYIPITRTTPVLSISGQDYICNQGHIAIFTANGVPAGASIVWSVSNGGLAFVGNNNSTAVTVSKASNIVSFVNISAIVTDCVNTYTIGPKEIALGTGRTTSFFSFHNVYCVIPQRAYYDGAVESFTSVTNYHWFAKDMSNPNNQFI